MNYQWQKTQVWQDQTHTVPKQPVIYSAIVKHVHAETVAPGPRPSPVWEIRLVSSPKEVKAYRGVDAQGRKLLFFSKDLLLEEQRGVVSYSLTTHCPVLFALGGLSISSARIPISTATPALLPGIVGEQERYFNQEQQEIKCMGHWLSCSFEKHVCVVVVATMVLNGGKLHNCSKVWW